MEVDEYVVTVGEEMCGQPSISNSGHVRTYTWWIITFFKFVCFLVQGILCNAPSSAPSGITDAQVVVSNGNRVQMYM